MKKMFLFMFFFLMSIPMAVKADYRFFIDVNVYLEENGNAHIIEEWDVRAESGAEWCKTLHKYDNSEITNLAVTMDDKLLEYKEWSTDGTIEEKAGYYGINYNKSEIEVCFGKSDYNRHSFNISYDVSNYIITTEDSQVLYQVLIPETSVDSFFIDIVGYTQFSDSLEVWGFGYEGNSYIENGRIVFSNYDGIKDQYAVGLVRFPLGTFKTENSIKKFKKFTDVYEDADAKRYESKKSVNGSGSKFIFLDFVFILLSVCVVILIIEFIYRRVTGHSMFNKEKIMPILNKVWDVIKKLVDKIVKFVKELFVKVKDMLAKNKKN